MAVLRPLICWILTLWMLAPASATATTRNAPARVAVLSAFEPELQRLLAATRQPVQQRINGITFTLGELEGQPVVLALSGISMVNAAMTTQLLLDRFTVSHIVFSGIAGGVNPALRIGDVTVPQQWASYLEALFARETTPGAYQAPRWMTDVHLPNFGMIHPRPVGVRRQSQTQEESRFWFEADAAMLAVARRIKPGTLVRCTATQACLSRQPQLVIGGNGVSGQAFVDNAAFRDYTFRTFAANVLDMETAAVAQVAWANAVPFIAFRSLSDLAGGGEGENEIQTFMQIAADNSAQVVQAFLRAWKP